MNLTEANVFKNGKEIIIFIGYGMFPSHDLYVQSLLLISIIILPCRIAGRGGSRLKKEIRIFLNYGRGVKWAWLSIRGARVLHY